MRTLHNSRRTCSVRLAYAWRTITEHSVADHSPHNGLLPGNDGGNREWLRHHLRFAHYHLSSMVHECDHGWERNARRTTTISRLISMWIRSYFGRSFRFIICFIHTDTTTQSHIIGGSETVFQIIQHQTIFAVGRRLHDVGARISTWRVTSTWMWTARHWRMNLIHVGHCNRTLIDTAEKRSEHAIQLLSYLFIQHTLLAVHVTGRTRVHVAHVLVFRRSDGLLVGTILFTITVTRQCFVILRRQIKMRIINLL